MTPTERLRQRLEEAIFLLEAEYTEEAFVILQELLGETSTCNCLANLFPHQRGKECPLNLTNVP